jgi:hypothetical protein
LAQQQQAAVIGQSAQQARRAGGVLFQAGLTGWCGLARLLALAPWNRRLTA